MAYLPHAMAYPQRYVPDPSIFGTAGAAKAKAACRYAAIDLEMQQSPVTLKADAASRFSRAFNASMST